MGRAARPSPGRPLRSGLSAAPCTAARPPTAPHEHGHTAQLPPSPLMPCRQLRRREGHRGDGAPSQSGGRVSSARLNARNKVFGGAGCVGAVSQGDKTVFSHNLENGPWAFF